MLIVKKEKITGTGKGILSRKIYIEIKYIQHALWDGFDVIPPFSFLYTFCAL